MDVSSPWLAQVGNTDHDGEWEPATGPARIGSPARQDGSGSVTETTLSVVIPTLNEERRIETCLDSVFRACRGVDSFEVILVDSNSDDRTVDIAREYPITILQLPSDELMTPGAGRYIGTKAASGDHILFVDGDMKLTDGWLADARRLLRERADVAGVGGHLNEADTDTIESVKTLHGVMLYDARVLERVGGFDPFLQGYEDIELGFRIRSAGYELVELSTVVATHSRTQDVSELRRRWKNGYLFGFGQALRKSVSSPRIVKDLVLRKWFQVLFLGWFVLGIGASVVIPAAAIGWVGLTGAMFVATALYEGFVPATMRFLWQGVAWTGYVRGFVSGSRDPLEYPVDDVCVLSVPETERTRESGGAPRDGSIETPQD